MASIGQSKPGDEDEVDVDLAQAPKRKYLDYLRIVPRAFVRPKASAGRARTRTPQEIRQLSEGQRFDNRTQ